MSVLKESWGGLSGGGDDKTKKEAPGGSGAGSVTRKPAYGPGWPRP